MSKRAVSLSFELRLLFQAVDGTRRLVEVLADSPRDGCPGSRELPQAVSAILVLVTERLRLLDLAARGTVDPRLLLCPENEAIASANGDGDGVLLPVWSERELARHHRAEWKRAKWSTNKREGST